MASHRDTGSMATPGHYSSKLLDHLGLVAGMYDELGIGGLIDRVLPQEVDKRKVSIGQAVKAMVLRLSARVLSACEAVDMVCISGLRQ